MAGSAWRCAALAATLLPATALPRPALSGPRQSGRGSPLAVGQESYEEELRGLSYEELPLETSAGFARNCYTPPHMRRIEDGADADWPKATYFMNQLKETDWMEFPPIPYVKRQPKLAVLMFTNDRVNNPSIWHNWMRRADKDNLTYSLHIHAYGISYPFEFQTKSMSKYVLKDKAWSTWCNMWAPQMLMLKTALSDPNVSHMMIVSADSIPVKPLRMIYSALEADPSTRMCADDQWRRDWPRAESWWLMRREDAELFQRHEGFAHNHFLNHCTEEQAWYYPLKMRADRWGNQSVVRNECPMFTDWADGPKACKVWRYNVGLCTGCDALRASSHVPSGFMHPVTFLNVNETSLKGLLDSPFWFARKFSVNSITPSAAMLLR